MIIGKLRQGIYLLAIAAFFAACTDDNSADPNVPGSDRDKFTGDWLCKETIGSTTTTFTITVQKHGSGDTLYVTNFSNIGGSEHTIWEISGNSVIIPAQTVSQVDFSGSGLYSNGEVTLNYSSDGDAVSAVCTQ